MISGVNPCKYYFLLLLVFFRFFFTTSKGNFTFPFTIKTLLHLLFMRVMFVDIQSCWFKKLKTEDKNDRPTEEVTHGLMTDKYVNEEIFKFIEDY